MGMANQRGFAGFGIFRWFQDGFEAAGRAVEEVGFDAARQVLLIAQHGLRINAGEARLHGA